MKKQKALTESELNELHKTCIEFINEQKINCPEVIFQSDWVSENSYEFIYKICRIVGYAENE